MSYQSEREAFIATMTAEGMPLATVRKILRHANTIQRCAMLECSSEAADRDRVRCPGSKNGEGCLCEGYGSHGACILTGHESEKEDDCSTHKHEHGMIPRIARTSARAEAAIAKACAALNGAGFVPNFQGDPRGACVKMTVPSGKTDDWGRTGICVPTREY